MEFGKSVHEKEKELKTQYQGDHKGYSEAMGKYLEQQEKEILKTSPNERARREMRFRLQELKMDQLQSAEAYENKKRAEHFVNNQARIVQETGVRYYQDPNPALALKEMPMTLSDMEREVGITATEETVKTMQQDYISNTRSALLDGLIDKGLYEQADAVLNSEQYQDLRQGMDAREMSKYSKILNQKKDKLVKEQIAEVSDMAENAIAANLSGKGTSPGMREQIMAVGRQIQGLPEGEEKARLMDSYGKSLKVADAMDLVKGMSIEEMEQIDTADIVGEDLETFKTDQQFRASFTKALQSNIKMRNEESAAYLEEIDPAMAGPQNVMKRVKRAKSLGVSSVRGVSKEESARRIQILESSPSSYDKAVHLDQLLKDYGDGSNQVLADMVKDGLNPTYMWAARYDDNIAKTRVLDNFVNKKALEEEFKVNRTKLDEKNVTDFAAQKTKDISASLRSSFGSLESSSSLINSMRSTVELEAKKLMTADSSLGAEEAVNKAYANTIDRNWGVAKYEGEQTHSVLIPKSVDKRDVNAFMKHYSTSEGLAALGVSSKRYVQFAGSDEEFREMISENSRFVTNETQDGVYLRFTDPQGREDYVVNSSGARVEIKFSEMPTQKYQKVLDERNSLFFGAPKLGSEAPTGLSPRDKQ